MRLALAFLLLLSSAAGAGAAVFPSQYDAAIRAAAARFLPGIPWRLYKAQLYQESRLDSAARSPVGAEGVAQFMPRTWAAIAPALGYGLADRRLAEPAIAGGAYYLAQLRGSFPQFADFERHDFAMASYNAGPGHIAKAWKLCGKPARWREAAPCLSSVTGRFAQETITYVRRIWRWYAAM